MKQINGYCSRLTSYSVTLMPHNTRHDHKQKNTQEVVSRSDAFVFIQPKINVYGRYTRN